MLSQYGEDKGLTADKTRRLQAQVKALLGLS